MVVEIISHANVRQELVDFPYYPSGNPATGPTYWRTSIQTYTDTTYEFVDAAGGRRNSSISGHGQRKGQCDHCAALETAWANAIKNLQTRKDAYQRRAKTIPRIQWDEIWLKVIVWGFVSVIPLGFALSSIRSFPLLFMGMAVAGAVGGGRSYSRQLRPIEEAEREWQKEEHKWQSDLEDLEKELCVLNELQNANRARGRNVS